MAESKAKTKAGQLDPDAQPEPFVSCETCKLQAHCWRSDLQPDQIAINLLVCRLQTRSGHDAAVAQLIPEITPGIVRGVETAKRYFPVRDSTEDLVREAQLPLIESLMTKFTFARRMHPLRWLFGSKAEVRKTGIPKGALPTWLRGRLRKEAGRGSKEESGHEQMYGHVHDEADSAEYHCVTEEDHKAAVETFERLVARLQADGEHRYARVVARALAYQRIQFRLPVQTKNNLRHDPQPDRALLEACRSLGMRRAEIRRALLQHRDIWLDHATRR